MFFAAVCVVLLGAAAIFGEKCDGAWVKSGERYEAVQSMYGTRWLKVEEWACEE